MSFDKKINYFVAVASLTLGFGCGIKGPPLPPIETIEDKVNSVPLNESKPTAPLTSSSSSDKTIAVPPK